MRTHYSMLCHKQNDLLFKMGVGKAQLRYLLKAKTSFDDDNLTYGDVRQIRTASWTLHTVGRELSLQ